MEGLQGWPLLRRKLRAVGGGALFHGALASTTSSIISHYPWFLVVRSFCHPPADQCMPWRCFVWLQHRLQSSTGSALCHMQACFWKTLQPLAH